MSKNTRLGGTGTVGRQQDAGLPVPVLGPLTAKNIFTQQAPSAALAGRTGGGGAATVEAAVHAQNPHSHSHSPVHITHILSSLNDPDYGRPSQHRDQPDSSIVPVKALDGFLLLEASGLGYPDIAQHIVVTNRRLNKIIDDDLPFFTNLQYLDVSENALGLEGFGALPSLAELRLTCNGISEVTSVQGFNELIILDLSYNKINIPQYIERLHSIPILKELDLSGNGLKSLPMEMYRFKFLEKLILDHNKIDDNFVFQILSAVPRLRYLSMASNYLWKVPPASCSQNCFRFLDVLDITSNYFNKEDDVMPLIDLHRLQTLMIYGNPVLGPTGEDPLKIYIEDLMAAAYQCREGSARKTLEIVTDVPRKRISLKSIVGRQAIYRNFHVTKLDKEGDSRTQREWRQLGQNTLFGEAMAALRKQSSAPTAIIDNTFLTSTLDMPDRTDAHVADDVMNRVAQDLGLTQSPGVAGIQRKIALAPPKILSALTANYNPVFQDQAYSDHDDTNPLLSTEGIGAGDSRTVPNNFFSRDLAIGLPVKQPNGMELKTAMRALKFAIEHPLTDYDDIPVKGLLGASGYVKPTQTFLNRKVERKEDPRSSSRLSRSGRAATTSFKSTFGPKSEDQTLRQMEEVLDSLNKNTDDLVDKHVGHGLNIKENITALSSFARPNTKIKGLVQMINDVVEDL